MADKLTIKQEKFAQGLFAGLSQREAYKQAYNAEKMTDKSIDEKACELANNGKVTERINQLTEELKQRNMVTVEKVINELATIGFSNTTDFVKVEEREYVVGYEKDEDGEENKSKPITQKGKGVNIYDMNQIDKEKLRALAGIKQGANGIEIKLHDKVKALELMGKYLGMFTDKVESKVTATNTNINIDADIDLFRQHATPDELANADKLSWEQIQEIMRR